MSHQINLSFSQKPCGCGGFFKAKHVPWVHGISPMAGRRNSVVLNIHPTQAFLLPCGTVTIPTLETRGQEGISLLWFPVTPRAGFHHNPVACDWVWGVPVSAPKTLRRALPFVKQINCTTKYCHILEAYWHNGNCNPHVGLYFSKRVKKRPR